MSRQTVPIAGVRIPKTVELDDDGLHLVWSYHNEQTIPQRRPTDRSVMQFSKLATADGASICAYARNHGVMEVVQIKPNHERDTDIKLTDGTIWRLGDRRAWAYGKKEPIGLWRSLAARLRAVLKINAALKGRTRNPLPSVGTIEDWNALGGGPPLEDVRDAQLFLRQEVNRWLLWGGIRLELGMSGLSVSRTKWELWLNYDGLIGGLAYRLLLMVIGEESLYVCDGCGEPYVRDKRAPRPGQENFCDNCTEVSRKRATERYRKRKRS